MVDRSETPGLLDDRAVASIRAALDRVLDSDAFRGAPQLTAFLSFIVERRLDGRAAELKGYTIAVEALGRPADFDPQSDPIVRVEAGRLRKALAHHYAGEGADDPVRIVVPVGAYVPVFEDVVPRPDCAPQGVSPSDLAAGLPPSPPDRVSRRWLLGAGLALAGLLTVGLWHGRRDGPGPEMVPRQQVRLTQQAARLPDAAVQTHLPVVTVVIGEPAGDTALDGVARAFARLLIDALARFDDLITVRMNAGAGDKDADYVFEMNAARVGEATEGFGRLRSVKDGRIVWTTSTSRSLLGGADDPELLEIARRLAIRLAEPFGIILADFRQVSPSSAMRCIFKALSFRRTMQAGDHLAARLCLEGVIEKDASFHPAWSHLAMLILDEQASGLNPQPGPPLDRALSAALTAMRLAPSSARAQQAMMDVLFARGAFEEALKAGQEAMLRNPYDPDIMADLGARYVQLNRAAEGLPLLERAVELSTGRPPWYDFFAFLAAHMLGANKLAEIHAAVLVADESPLSLLGRALQAAKTGDDTGLAAPMRRLAQIEPLFALDARLYLVRKGFAAVVAERIIAEIGPDGFAAISTR